MTIEYPEKVAVWEAHRRGLGNICVLVLLLKPKLLIALVVELGLAGHGAKGEGLDEILERRQLLQLALLRYLSAFHTFLVIYILFLVSF